MRHLQGKMLASEKRKLVRMFHAYMQELGATKHDGYFSYQYALDTKAGPLELSATLSPSGVNIFTRFKDAKRGAEITGNSNPFSGKWNHHYLSRMTAEDAMENLRLHMDYVLPSSKW